MKKALVVSFAFALLFIRCGLFEKTSPLDIIEGTIILETTINSALQPAVASVPGKIKVTVPAGLVPVGTKLTIGEINLPDAPPDPDLNLHKVFDVVLGSVHQFTTPIDIAINYDPAKATAGNKLRPIGASYYHKDLQRWAAFPDCIVDSVAHTVNFKTDHLTKLSSWDRRNLYGYTDYFDTTHFTIYWKSGDPMDNTAYTSPNAALYPATSLHYILDIGKYLEETFTAFKAESLWVPSGKVDVYIKDLGSEDGNSSFFGYLNINKTIKAAASGLISDAVQQTAAHEFLHYVQDYYYMQLFSDYTTKWWMEATATQADHMVWPARTYLETVEWTDKVLQTQLDRSWDDCNEDPNWYIAGGFLGYLSLYRTGAKADIAALIREGGNNFSISFIRTIINDYCQRTVTGWKGIGREYADYVNWAFVGSGKITIPVTPVISSPDPYITNYTLSTTTPVIASLSIPHMAAKVIKLKNTSTTLNNFAIKMINLDSSIISNTLYTTYAPGKPSRYSGNYRTGDSISMFFSGGSNSWVDFLFVNTSKDNAASVSVKIGLYQDLGPCVAAGTKVLLSSGSEIPIETVKPNDKIVACDTVKNLRAEAVVEKMLTHNDKPYSLSALTLDNNRELNVTANHPLFVAKKGWVKVENVNPGDIILAYDNAGRKMVESKVLSIIRDKSTCNVVYNLKTSKGNYIANGVLVHNKCLKQGSLIETPAGLRPVEQILPGDLVYALKNGTRVLSEVTNTYDKETVLPYLPGKKLGAHSEATVNHFVFYNGRFTRAGNLSLADSRIFGKVYDLKTRDGNYFCEGTLLKCGN
jgi:hypothetical protein